MRNFILSPDFQDSLDSYDFYVKCARIKLNGEAYETQFLTTPFIHFAKQKWDDKADDANMTD